MLRSTTKVLCRKQNTDLLSLRSFFCRYPSHARMWLAPIRTGLGDKKREDFDIAMDDWSLFVQDTQTYYGVNMNALTKAYRAEHEKYYLKV